MVSGVSIVLEELQDELQTTIVSPSLVKGHPGRIKLAAQSECGVEPGQAILRFLFYLVLLSFTMLD